MGRCLSFAWKKFPYRKPQTVTKAYTLGITDMEIKSLIDDIIGITRVVCVLALFAFAIGALITGNGVDIVIMFSLVLIAFEQVLQTNALINGNNR